MDTHALLDRIDLKTLAEEAGARFNSSLSSHCPLHSGSDNNTAFHLFRGQDGRQLWHCFTRCPEGENGGDAINFYMRWRRVDFKTAIHELRERVGMFEHPSTISAPASQPASLWRKRAAEFIEYAQDQLWSPNGQRALAYLREQRGYNDDTIRDWCLGYNPRDVWDDPARWGLDDSKRVWCAQGIVFPTMRGEAVQSANIRRPLVGGSLARYIGPVDRLPDRPKFAAVRGGRRSLFGENHLHGNPILILTEGEPDTILAWQEINDLADVLGLSGARRHINALDAALLTRASIILGILDMDQAGAEGSAYLQTISERIMVIQPPAHDLTDYWRERGDLRNWLVAQIADTLVVANIEMMPDAVISNLLMAMGVAPLEQPTPNVRYPIPNTQYPMPAWTTKLPVQLADLPDFIRRHDIRGARIVDEGPGCLVLLYDPQETELDITIPSQKGAQNGNQKF